MINITEQGFLRRNWGKLALGGGALALAGMHGGELSKDALGGAVKSGSDAAGETVKKAREAITNAVKNPKETLRKGAEAVGAGTRKAVDTGKDIKDSAIKGYKGTGETPNVPNVQKQNIPGAIPPMRLSPSHGDASNIPANLKSSARGLTGSGASADYNRPSRGVTGSWKPPASSPNIPGVIPQDTSAARVRSAINTGVDKTRSFVGAGIDKARSALKANSERVEDIANSRRLQRAKEIGRFRTRSGEPVPNQYGT